MTFTLHTPDGSEQHNGNDAYRFTDHGLLVITAGGKQTTYAPGTWTRIEEKSPDNTVRGF